MQGDGDEMNWDAAIKMHQQALLAMVSVMLELAGIVAGGSVETLPRWVRSKILNILRPSESATRRLILVYAFIKGIKMPRLAPRENRAGPLGPIKRGTGQRPPPFQLIDPRKCFDKKPPRRAKGSGPRISIPGYSDPVFEEVVVISPEDELSAASLCRRLEALRLALLDLDKQARRMRRMEAKRKQAPPGPGCVPPLRPGTPPGFRRRQTHPVDEILAECHRLARYLMDRPVDKPDTS